MSEYSTTGRKTKDMTGYDLLKELEAMAPETPTTITVPVDSYSPQPGGAHPMFLLRDLIAAVQDAGYLVYESGELPEVTTTPNGNQPKLPSHWGSTKKWVDGKYVEVSRVQAYYEEAFGKLALARWHEAEERRREKQKAALLREIQDVPSRTNFETDAELAAYLIERGWRRG